jgi:hypothetical protein
VEEVAFNLSTENDVIDPQLVSRESIQSSYPARNPLRLNYREHYSRALFSELSMNYKPVQEQSRQELDRLIQDVRSRGDECLAVLLEGVELYVSLGRELDLLEIMRQFERDIRPAVEGTPTALDLHRLYQLDSDSGES